MLVLSGISASAFGQQSAPNAEYYGPSETPPVSPEATAAAAAEKAAAERREREAELQAVRQEFLTAQSAERVRQDAELARLRGEIEALKQEQANEKQRAADALPVVTAARLGLGLTGYVQIDWVVANQASEDQLNGSTGAPLNQDRFLVRRARLRATVDRTYVAGLLEFDGNTVKGPAARIAGAEASLKWDGDRAPGAPPLIMATMGLFKIPFGFEVGESDRERLFLERTTTSHAFFPSEYDLGARLMGGWRFLRYMVAVQNGEPVGESSFPGLDPNHQKDFVGRLGIDSGFEGPIAVVAGFSLLSGTGFHAGTPATKPTIQWVDSNEDGNVDPNEIKRTPGQAATPSQNFPRHGAGADLRVTVRTPRLGDTTAYGEVYYGNDLDRGILPADPTGAIGAVGRSYREVGWYAALMQDLGPHATVGVRYDYYNPDRDSNDLQVGVIVPSDASYSTVALVGALRAPAGRLIVEYDINRNHLGRDAAGLPTNLQDNAFTIRGEVRF